MLAVQNCLICNLEEQVEREEGEGEGEKEGSREE